MEEELKNNYFNTKNSIKDNSYNIYPKLKSYGLTEINGYKNKSNFKGKNLLLSNIFSNNKIGANRHKKKEKSKIYFIKSLIRKQDDKLYDGYLCMRKKPTINYLLNKSKTQEEKKLLEDNILFQNPYPLIKCLSNRKIPNKSNQLLTGILSSEFNDLSIEQKKEMLYKPKKHIIKFDNIEYPTIKSISNDKTYNNFRYIIQDERNFSISTTSKRKNPNLKINTIYNVKNVNLNKYLNNKSLTKTNSENKKRFKICNLKKFHSFYNNIKLKEHSTMTVNRAFLKKNFNNKFITSNMKQIIKDISRLKYNKHLMSINY